MEFSEYQHKAMRTVNKSLDKKEMLLNASLGLSGESGEVADIIKKFAFHGHELDKEKIRKELGDVLWYLALASEALGVSLNDIARGNVEKLLKRYPDGFDSDRSINREEGEK
ncbi:nucleoside triphosphate pyrophosphohydrolase family protein [Chengkuizengella axinellae]|uniref:Nucleoside triphosphate pyrophosphohydrolase family protein n=1 Tax=Chengkuizengella axinellae TaxID=3064388 RepID=A0ABT9J6F2_9BACL|nr:nucleoside triphosphate pyrophosphohydrolase family protein [Chengkuizengella sp. 2205SS18-9]MDP5277197.1 nucleoside triphosphate pyrophosphohydrolase family protein [Chengkuizengella sp. 2205SS18-9]